MQLLNISGLAMIFAVVRLTTSTVLGQRWATKPYETPNGYTRPAMHYQPVTAPDQAGAEENTVPLVMTGDMIEDNSMAGEQEANIHKHPHTGMTSTMPGQHSSPVTTETMTVNHPEHQQHQGLPVMTQKPGLSNAPDSIEAMIEEMSEHDEMISIHEFKEVLHELVKDAVDKIVMKKVGIVGKLKTAKQNLIGHDGEATGRNPQQFGCHCNPSVFDSRGRGNCNSDFNGRRWCYLEHFSSETCSDAKPSAQLRGFFWSHEACEQPTVIFLN